MPNAKAAAIVMCYYFAFQVKGSEVMSEKKAAENHKKLSDSDQCSRLELIKIQNMIPISSV